MQRAMKMFVQAVVVSAMLWVVEGAAAQGVTTDANGASGTSAASQSSPTLVVPAGTVVPLTLVNGIKSRSTPIGGTVRASVAFPVTVGTRLAIPAGVYVEGQLVQASFPKGHKQPKGSVPTSPLEVHFTKLIYPNGYTVALDAQVSARLVPMDGLGASDGVELAEVEWPSVGRRGGPSDADPWEAMAAEAPQQQPVTNPYAHAGPNPAVIYGPIIATGVVAAALVIAAHHHGESLDSVVFGAGYPFQMTLAAPLTLDRTRIGKDATVDDSGGL